MRSVIYLSFLFAGIFSLANAQDSPGNATLQQQQFDRLYASARGYFVAGKTDSLPPVNEQMLQLSEKLERDSDRVKTYISIGNYFHAKSDNAGSIEYLQKAATLAEASWPGQLTNAYNSIAVNYIELENYPLALRYLRKGRRGFAADQDGLGRTRNAYQVASVFAELHMPDSAAFYIKLAEHLNRAGSGYEHDFSEAGILRCFALVNERQGKSAMANYYFKRAIRFADSSRQTSQLNNALELYSRYLYQQRQYSDVKNYAQYSFTVAKEIGKKLYVADAADILYKLYKMQGRTDSMLYFLETSHTCQNNLLAEQKTNQLQTLIVNQQLDDAEQAANAAQAEEQRHHNIEYAAIAFGIIVLAMLFFLLSRSIIVGPRVIELFGVIGLLIIFEFVNLVLHPFLAAATDDSPLLMLAVLVIIAAVIVPVHHKLEHWVKNKLVEKNKAIHRDAAKREQKNEG
jgi:hypothetical protein